MMRSVSSVIILATAMLPFFFLKVSEALRLVDVPSMALLVETATQLRVDQEADVEAMVKILLMPQSDLFHVHGSAFQAQIKDAREKGDLAAQNEALGRLKHLYFSGGPFTLSAFKHSRSQEEFAQSITPSHAADGVTSEGMWLHSKLPLPTTLTVKGFQCPPATEEHEPSKEERAQAKELHKTALRLNKNVLGYMGDRQLQYPAMLARELVKEGYDKEELRDELYCQVLTQLCGNGDQGSVDNGLVLLGIMLSTFSPSEDLEHFVEIFLADRKEGELLAKLNLIAHGAAVPGVPRLKQIEGLHGKRGEHRRFSIWGRESSSGGSDGGLAADAAAAVRSASSGEKKPKKGPVAAKDKGGKGDGKGAARPPPPPRPTRPKFH